MKKLTYFIFMFILLFSLVGCKDNDDKEDDNKKDDPMFEGYKTEWETYFNELVPDEVTSKIDFEEEYYFEDGSYAFIEWESSNLYSINGTGKCLKNVVDNKVVLTTKVYIDGYDSFEVSKTVQCYGFMTEEEFKQEFEKAYLPDVAFENISLKTTEDELFANIDIYGTIKYTSSDETILGSDGKYNTTSSLDTNVEMSYVVDIRGLQLTGSKTINVLGRNDVLRVENGIKWLEEEWNTTDNFGEYILDDITLPLTDEIGIVNFIWESNTKDLIDDAGVFYDYEVGREITLSVKVVMNEEMQTVEFKFKTMPKEDIIEYIMNRMHKDEIYQSYFRTYVVSSGYNNSDFGFLNFYTQDVSESDLILSEPSTENYVYGENSYNENTSKKTVNSLISHLTFKRPMITKKSTDFICIHDTGDNQNSAEAWANEVLTSTREVSWHFTVDDKDIYQQIPLNEVAYHAGDGSNTFGLRDTGVKYTVKDPELEFKEDGYLYINGIKSGCLAPVADGKYQTAITDAWLYTERGENGNYYINNYYYNATYKKISNGGGNRNSIGIETCVIDGVFYGKVMRSTANLVAHLLNLYDLDTTRVLQHRNFSGKLCPQSMIRASKETEFTWDNFMELVEIEYFILKYLPDLDVTYTSNNPDVVDNNGNILKYVTEKTEVSYDVKVMYERKEYKYNYKTIINPIA